MICFSMKNSKMLNLITPSLWGKKKLVAQKEKERKEERKEKQKQKLKSFDCCIKLQFQGFNNGTSFTLNHHEIHFSLS